MSSTAAPPTALDTTLELIKRAENDLIASKALIQENEKSQEDTEELIWLLKEDNNQLKVC